MNHNQTLAELAPLMRDIDPAGNEPFSWLIYTGKLPRDSWDALCLVLEEYPTAETWNELIKLVPSNNKT